MWASVFSSAALGSWLRNAGGCCLGLVIGGQGGSQVVHKSSTGRRHTQRHTQPQTLQAKSCAAHGVRKPTFLFPGASLHASASAWPSACYKLS